MVMEMGDFGERFVGCDGGGRWGKGGEIEVKGWGWMANVLMGGVFLSRCKGFDG